MPQDACLRQGRSEPPSALDDDFADTTRGRVTARPGGGRAGGSFDDLREQRDLDDPESNSTQPRQHALQDRPSESDYERDREQQPGELRRRGDQGVDGLLAHVPVRSPQSSMLAATHANDDARPRRGPKPCSMERRCTPCSGYTLIDADAP